MSDKIHDCYKPVTDAHDAVSPCPVCGAAAEVWRYSEAPDSPSQVAVMCTNSDPIGPQEAAGAIHSGCLLYMPPDEFYRPTIREAVRYWNQYATTLVELRISRWNGEVKK